MARIRIESLVRPEEDLTGSQSAHVVGAGYGYGYGFSNPFYGGVPYGGYAPAFVTTPYIYGAATPFYNPVYAGLGGASITPGLIGPSISPAGFGGFGYGPFRY